MKVLYAIQGTGNGHISRAREVIPLLKERCELDVLVSGTQSDLSLPFEVKYRLRGMSFIFGKKGGVDFWNTYVEANMEQFLKEIRQLPVNDYQFVINDFEPVSSWACYIKEIPSIAFSHQSAILGRNVPMPEVKDPLGKFILKNYAPYTTSYGLHFSRYSKNIFTPVIRSEIRNIHHTNEGHYVVYLPSYSTEFLVDILTKASPDVHWKIFSRQVSERIIFQNIELLPVSNDSFIQNVASAKGVLCGAGFETPAETLFLGKKLMVIPMKNQFEQQCNAAALKAIGVPVLKKLKEQEVPKLKEWIHSDYRINIHFPDETALILDRIFDDWKKKEAHVYQWERKHSLSFLSEYK